MPAFAYLVLLIKKLVLVACLQLAAVATPPGQT